MTSIEQSQRSTVPAQSATHLLVSGDMAFQARELLTRLDSEAFAQRLVSSRRPDGELVLENSADPTLRVVDIRLNAHSAGLRVVIRLYITEGSIAVPFLMKRESKFGGDDRSEFLIPTPPISTDGPLVDNVILGACICVGRGTVRPPGIGDKNSMTPGRTFKLFLPSLMPLPSFDQDFNVRGLPASY